MAIMQSQKASFSNYGELESLNRKLRAIHRLRGIIFRMKKGAWKLEDICDALTARGAYLSVWIALMDPDGAILHFAESGLKEFLGGRYGGPADYRNETFASSLLAFLQRGEPAEANRDPLLIGGGHSDAAVPEGAFIITLRIEYRDRVFGVLSASFRAGTYPIEDETLILYEAAKDIAFALHDMEAAAKEQELRAIVSSLEEHHRTIFETTGNATCVFEEDTIISLANADFERLSGFSKDEIEGKMSWTSFIEKGDVDKMVEYHRLRRIDPKAAPRNYYFRFIDRGGAVKDIYMTIALVPNTKKSIASFMDITEQKRLEQEVLRISESERREIGSTLHDGLGPHLVGVKFMLNLLKQKLARRGVTEGEDIDEISALIDQAVSQTRHLVKGLCPVDIDSEGLAYALGDLANGVRRLFGISCTLEFDESIKFADNTAATQIYYIVREAVNNAMKHSGAKHIGISMKKSGPTLILTVKDDGKGIETLDNTRGMGINIMKYRAHLINSFLDIMRNGEGGTSVVCILRMEGKENRHE